jgi:hypothetical protein
MSGERWDRAPDRKLFRGTSEVARWPTCSFPLRLSCAWVLFLAGCSTSDPEIYEPEQGRGAVDINLPPEQRQKQEALARLFEAFRRGVHPGDLEHNESDLAFQEAEEQFFEDTVRVWAWDWDGPPRGDRFPVRLTMQKDEPGVVTVDYRRVYRVERRGSTFVIQRAK